jgi:hypothetical protein
MANGRLPPLRDSEIRLALRQKLSRIHADEPDTAIINELSLVQGEARVDVAVVNGSFSGYEIKSDRDTLIRLPHQLAVYERCFNTLTIVVGSSHVAACTTEVPSWWGIWEAIRLQDAPVTLEERREPINNEQICPGQVVQLLWRDEALAALRDWGILVPSRTARRQLWETLTASLSPDDLLKTVRDRIRLRGDWRSGPTPFRCGDSFRSVAKSQRSQMNRRWLLSALSQHRPS